MDKEELEIKPRIVKIRRMKRLLSCSFCKPHQQENARGSSHKPKIRMRGWKDKLKKNKQYETRFLNGAKP